MQKTIYTIELECAPNGSG